MIGPVETDEFPAKCVLLQSQALLLEFIVQYISIIIWQDPYKGNL